MKQNNYKLRYLINTAKTLSTNITMSIRNNFPIDTDTQNLLGIAKQIILLINDSYKGIANVLTGAISGIKNYQAIPMPPYGQLVNKEVINLYSLRDIMTTINILDSIVEELKPNQNSRKIFISHSSADEAIVNALKAIANRPIIINGVFTDEGKLQNHAVDTLYLYGVGIACIYYRKYELLDRLFRVKLDDADRLSSTIFLRSYWLCITIC